MNVKIVGTLLMLFLIFNCFFFISPTFVYAQTDPCVDCSALPPGVSPLQCPNCALQELGRLASIFLGYAMAFAVLATVIIIIIGGFKYITAGDPKAVASARDTLTWAIVGLMVVSSTWVILKILSAIIPGGLPLGGL